MEGPADALLAAAAQVPSLCVLAYVVLKLHASVLETLRAFHSRLDAIVDAVNDLTNEVRASNGAVPFKRTGSGGGN